MQRLAQAWGRLGRGCSEALQLAARSAEAGAACAPAAECSCSGRVAAAAAPGAQWQQLRFASKKQGGSTQNTKDSQPKYLGVKLFGGQKCIPGNIIIRQRGTEFHPGANVGMGRDHTIYSLIPGRVKFSRDPRTKRRLVSVEPLQAAGTAAAPAPAAAVTAQQQPAAVAATAAAV